MAARNRFVKVRLSPKEYGEVARRADGAGVTLCEQIRQQVLTVHAQLDMQAELSSLRTLFAIPSTSDQPTGELFAAEALLLLRELVAGRDTQTLGRVAQRLDALYSTERRKI